MKEHPIIFSAEDVRAIRDGRKTQMRIVVRPQLGTDPFDRFIHIEEDNGNWSYWWDYICGPGPTDVGQEYLPIRCPYGQPGSLLWVRETWRRYSRDECACYDECVCPPGGTVLYRADNDHEAKWRPSIHMPYEACRLWLRLKSVNVERLQAITNQDAVAEGVSDRAVFALLWNKLNAKKPGRSWADNPWVWALDFEKAVKPSNFKTNDKGA